MILEWDSNLANSCSVIEKNEFSEVYFFLNSKIWLSSFKYEITVEVK